MAERKRPKKAKKKINFEEEFSNFSWGHSDYDVPDPIYNLHGVPYEIIESPIQRFTLIETNSSDEKIIKNFDGLTNFEGMVINDENYCTADNAELESEIKMEYRGLLGNREKFITDEQTGEIIRNINPVYSGVDFIGEKPPAGTESTVTFSGYLNILNMPLKKKKVKKILDSKGSLNLSLEGIVDINLIRIDDEILDPFDYNIKDSSNSTLHIELDSEPVLYNLKDRVELSDKFKAKKGTEITIFGKGFKDSDKIAYLFKDYETSIDESGNIPFALMAYLNIESIKIGDDSFNDPNDIGAVLEFKNSIGVAVTRKYEPSFPAKVQLVNELAHTSLSLRNKKKYAPGTPVTMTYTAIRGDSYIRNND